ncbi:MAG: amidinotransferase [Candidatus Marinimicrobia bacterium]|nr:amidinotransferase [Candidatus Neomarinimicrobiota bacterium]
MAQFNNLENSAYGGPGWSLRLDPLRAELGTVWTKCGINSEYARLKSVLLHRPGDELTASEDPQSVQMLSSIDVEKATDQHDALAEAYGNAGVQVHYVDPDPPPSPNQMFLADLLFSTPEGIIIGRPASTVRAGEERWAARRLADLGIPIVRSISGHGTFEGADAMWIRPDRAIVGRGLRTNEEGRRQVTEVLEGMGCHVVNVDMPVGTMHLMGMLRFLDGDLAIGWPLRFAQSGVEALKESGYKMIYVPDQEEAVKLSGFNFVTIGPREIVMPALNPQLQSFLEGHDVTCHTVDVSELSRAAGAIGCLTGVLYREPV